MQKMRLLGRFLRYFFVKSLTRMLPWRAKYREIWLFSERGCDAADNAFALFQYVRKREPARQVYYILERDATCLAKVRACGSVVFRGSLRHLFLYFLPTVKISTHILGTSPDSGFFASPFAKRYLRAAGKQVFLQHGITHADIPALHAENRPELSLFVSGSAVEYEYLKQRYGYPEDILRYLGLARFDLLGAEAPKRQILCFITWRSSLSHLSDEAFMATAYFRDISRFLSDVRLHRLLAQYETRLVFAPHFEMHRFASLFRVESPYISLDLGDVGALIRASAMLITDHSSVMFDFAYREAPVLYMAFEGLCDDHYDARDFPLETTGFGAVSEDMATLLWHLEIALRRGFSVEEPYLSRMRAHFPTKDVENCRRNYEAILDIAK